MFQDWGGCTNNGAATLDCVKIVFTNLLHGISAFAGIIALVMFIIVGIKYISSSGDAKKLESAKNTFSYALLGLMISLFAFFIIKIIYFVTGVKCITTFGFGC